MARLSECMPHWLHQPNNEPLHPDDRAGRSLENSGIASGSSFRTASLCGLSRKACVVLVVVAIALLSGLAVGLALGLRPEPQGPAPPTGRAFNAACGVDTDCVSGFCFTSRCSQGGTVPDIGECDRSKQCESGFCDGEYGRCKNRRGSLCAGHIGIENYCASGNCAKNGTCV